MNEQLTELWSRLPDYLGGHILLSIVALGAALVASVPLGVVASRRPKLAEALLGVAGVLQTVPSLALLVLMVPLLGGLIGFVPACIALTLYSVLPILANTVLGIRGVDPTLIEAARGLGMSDGQLLRRVQFPLALPVIVGGIRTATVMAVGTATLATPVGGLSLGNYIFAGLEMNDTTATVFGCVFAALLAVVMDQMVRLLETAARRRSRRLAMLPAAGLLLVCAYGLYGPVSRCWLPPAPVIATSAFSEQYILSEVIKGRLAEAGFGADQRLGVGGMIHSLALRHNQIDCTVTYTGDVWSTVMHRKDLPTDRQNALDEVRRFLHEQDGAVCLGTLGFENAYVLAMPRNRLPPGVRTIEDLVRKAPNLTIGADLEFFHRPEWAHLRKEYGLQSWVERPMNSSLMYGVVGEGTVDVICAYSTDGRILEKDLVILEDKKHAFPPYDALLVLSARAAADPKLVEALRPLVGSIDVQAMQQANLRVDVERRSPSSAAAELLRTISPPGKQACRNSRRLSTGNAR